MPGMTMRSRSPDAVRVKEILRTRIANGSYPRGSWLPTERSLTVELNVSRTAIRAALTALEQQGIIVRLPGKRPWVNDTPVSNGAFSAKSSPLLTAKPPDEEEEGFSTHVSVENSRIVRRFAVVLPNKTADLATRAILNGIHRALRIRQINYRLLTFDTQVSTPSSLGKVGQEIEACTAIEHEGIEGVIVWPLAGEPTLVEWRRMQERGVALVCVDRIPPGLACDFVGVDNYGAAREAVEYLLRRGHRRIAHITSDEAASTVQERLRGYRDAMLGTGNPLPPEWTLTISHNIDNCPTDEEIVHFLQMVAPTGIFTMNDHIAHYFVHLAETMGLVVGKDISIIGFDDIDRYSPRPALLTTMRQPFERIGECAAELLLQRNHGTTIGRTEKVFRQYYLSAPLIERTTCGAYPVKSIGHSWAIRGRAS